MRRIPSWAGLGVVLAGLALGGAACSSDDDGSSVDTGIEQPAEAPAADPTDDSDPAGDTDPAADGTSDADTGTDGTESTDGEADTSADESDG